MAAEQYLVQGVSACGTRWFPPVLGPIVGFPPTFMAVGAGEVLADDSRRFAAALRAGGVPTQLLEVPGMEHVALARGRELPGAAQTFLALTEFIALLIGRPKKTTGIR